MEKRWITSLSSRSCWQTAQFSICVKKTRNPTSKRQESKAGRLGVNIRALAECPVRDDTVIVTVQYRRKYQEGKVIDDAVLYTVTKIDDWRITSVMPVAPGTSMQCTFDGDA